MIYLWINYQYILGNVRTLFYGISQNMLEIHSKIWHNFKVDIWLEVGLNNWISRIKNLIFSISVHYTEYGRWLGQNISAKFEFPAFSVHILISDEQSQSKVLQVCLFFAKIPSAKCQLQKKKKIFSWNHKIYFIISHTYKSWEPQHYAIRDNFLFTPHLTKKLVKSKYNNRIFSGKKFCERYICKQIRNIFLKKQSLL